jgi:hypothetical protein
MFKKLLTTTALVACTALSAQANADDTAYYYRGDTWKTFQSTIQPQNTRACGMMTDGHNDRGQYALFSVKNLTYDGVNGLFFMLSKEGWNLPGHDVDTGVPVPLAMGFDNDPKEYLVSEGRGYTGSANGYKMPTVEYTVRETEDGQTNAWLEMFAHADRMWIKFKAGNERTWSFDMKGTRSAVIAYHRCMNDIARQQDTVPYSSAPTTRRLGRSRDTDI